MTGPPLVSLTTVLGTFAADALKGALEEAGIPAMTRAEQHSSWLFPGAGGGLGPVEVLVGADRLSEAQSVLAALEAAEGEPDSRPPRPSTIDRCLPTDLNVIRTPPST